MKPKTGEAILIGPARTFKEKNIFAGLNGEDEELTIGGDRSYFHNVWVCLACEGDQCAVMMLMPKGKNPRWTDFGAHEPCMIGLDWYPVNRCGEEMLKAMTGYTFADDLLAAVNAQREYAAAHKKEFSF